MLRCSRKFLLSSYSESDRPQLKYTLGQPFFAAFSAKGYRSSSGFITPSFIQIHSSRVTECVSDNRREWILTAPENLATALKRSGYRSAVFKAPYHPIDSPAIKLSSLRSEIWNILRQIFGRSSAIYVKYLEPCAISV